MNHCCLLTNKEFQMPRPILLTFALTALIAGLSNFASSQAANPPDPVATAKLMLNQGWAKTKAAKDVVKQQNLNAPELKEHSLVRAAHWLVLMYQDQHDLALDSIHAYLKKHPTSL